MPTRKRVTPCLREATRRLRANCFAKRKTTWSASGASTPTVPPCRAEAKLPISLHTNRKRPPSRPSRKEATKNERHFHSIFGLALKSPLVASASPLCESVPNIRELEDAGIGAVVLPSLFEEQLELESNALDDDLWRGAESYPESQSLLPDLQNYNLGPDGYLDLIEGAKAAVDIPVIASLNGVLPGGWAEYARLMAE